MMDSAPLTLFDILLFSSLTLLILFLLGYAAAHILQRYLMRKKAGILPFTAYKFDFPTLLAFYLGLGMVTLVLLLTLLLMFPGFFVGKITFVIAFSLILFSYTLYNRVKTCELSISQRIKNMDKKWIFSLVILIFTTYGVYHFVRPAIGLYAYPGGDDIPRAFYSNVIIHTGHLPFLSFGYPYGTPAPTWALQAFPILGAFFSIMYQTSIAKTHLFLLQLNRGLTPLFTYAFVEVLLKESSSLERQLCGFCSMIGLIFSLAQYRYFFWGGIGESIGFNIALTLLMGYLFMKRLERRGNSSRGRKSLSYFFFFFFSILLMAYTGARVLLLFVLGILGLVVIEIVKREGGIRTRGASFFGAIASLYVIASIVGIYGNGLFSHIFSPFHAAPASDSLILTRRGELEVYCSRLLYYLHRIHGRYVLFFLILGFAGIALHARGKENIIPWYPVLVAILLFIFSQNNPDGLYFFPYPGIAPLQRPERCYYLLLVPFSMVQGIGSGLVIADLLKITVIGGKKLSRKIKHANHNQISPSLRKLFGSLLALVVLLSCVPAYNQAKEDYQWFILEKPKMRRPITSSDLEAFQWMEGNIHGRQRFLTSGYDTGKWIPVYTDHIVLPPSALRLRSPNASQFDTLVSLLIKGVVNGTVMRLLEDFQINYIYVGIVRRFPPAPGTFDRRALNKTFDLVFASGGEGFQEKVMIFQVNQQ